MTTLDDLRLSAEACGRKVATARSWARFGKSSHECWIHLDHYRDGAMEHWNPPENPAQWQECILKLLEIGDLKFLQNGHGPHWFWGDVASVFNCDCPAKDFPHTALAELWRRREK